jgi:hypothetical protein
MSVFLGERRGSGDFTSNSGKLLFYVLGATDQDDAEAQVLADPRAADQIGEFLLDDVSSSDQGGDLYFVDLDYKRGVPNPAAALAGETPTNSRPAPAGQDHTQPLGRDVTFTMGGGTRKVYQSLETLYKIARAGDVAPDFGQVIGYNRKTGEIEGCEIVSATSDFTITKRFANLTIGWFRTNMDLVATVNEVPYLGCDKGEVLYKGADGQYKDGDTKPWTVTGRFGYGRNRANVPIDDPDLALADLVVPLVRGHEYVWVTYKELEWPVTIDGVEQKFKVQRPQFAYCERVYNYPSEVSAGRIHRESEGYTPTSADLTFHDLGFD